MLLLLLRLLLQHLLLFTLQLQLLQLRLLLLHLLLQPQPANVWHRGRLQVGCRCSCPTLREGQAPC